jgi:hypothetical protein
MLVFERFDRDRDKKLNYNEFRDGYNGYNIISGSNLSLRHVRAITTQPSDQLLTSSNEWTRVFESGEDDQMRCIVLQNSPSRIY